MIEEIEFYDTNHKVSVTIDNETKDLPIKEIKKLPTYIGVNQSLNTALNNNIDLDATIYYAKNISDTVDNDDTVSRQLTLTGPDIAQLNKDSDFTVLVEDDISNNIVTGEEVVLLLEDEVEVVLDVNSEKNIIENKDNINFTILAKTPDNTPLNNTYVKLYAIDSDGYVDDSVTFLSQANKVLNIDGTVTVIIYNGDDIYYSQNIFFKKGSIIDSIKNTLPLGSYTMVIEYAGNKYFEASELIINFDVEKRLGVCEFDSYRYSGDFLEAINIQGILKDNEKGTPVSNCTLNYDFNDESHTADTNANGEFTLSVTIPSPDISHCNMEYDSIDESYFEPGDLYEEQAEEEFIDENGNIRLYSDIEDVDTLYDENSDNPTNIETIDDDGNIIHIQDGSEDIIQSIETNDNINPHYDYPEDIDIEAYYPNVSYLITVYTDNESYYLNNTEIEVLANKAPTSVTVDSSNPEEVSNILNLHGSVFATYNNCDNDVKYGKINIELPDFNYKHDTINIENSNFSTNINLAEVYSVYNSSEVVDIVPYDTTKTMFTSIVVSGDIYNEEKNNVISKGDSFSIEAEVKSTTSTDYVKDGVIIFYLYKPDNLSQPFHQYATEIDRTGKGIFNFNTSKKATYIIEVEYVGIFGYNGSISEQYEVRIE